MLALDDRLWAHLEGNFGSGDGVARLLRSAERGEPPDAWYEELTQELCHQGTVSEVAYAAVPHLVRIAEARPELRSDLLIHAGWCYASAQLECAAAVPPELVEAWQAAPARALELAVQSLRQTQPEEETFRHLLSALASFQGHYALAFVLERLDGGIDCPSCGAWIEAMTSSLNPLSGSRSP